MPLDTLKNHRMLGKNWSNLLNRLQQETSPLRFGYLPSCAAQGLVMVLQMPLIEELRRQCGLAAIQ
jgi:hypothetical protein